MAVQIYSKEFVGHANTSYYACEGDEDVRRRVLKEANDFFFKHDNLDIVNVVENWNQHRDYLNLVVYYKDYI
jgi:hypothetical protein